MVTFGLLVALTLASHTLQTADGAAVRNPQSSAGTAEDDQKLTPQEAHQAVTVQCRFCSCRLRPKPNPRDLIEHRHCIRRILDNEGNADVQGRRERSTGNKYRRQMVQRPGDVSTLLVTGAGVKPRLSRSLEALCAGDLSRYDHDVREYIQWRCKNGYGQLIRRWGRSATITSGKNDGNDFQFENEVVTGSADSSEIRRYKMAIFKARAKRDEADDMRAIVEAYREWRSQNGYGQTSGRWG